MFAVAVAICGANVFVVWAFAEGVEELAHDCGVVEEGVVVLLLLGARLLLTGLG